MIISKEDLYSDKQTIATAVGTDDSDNILDWGNHGDDLGRRLTLFCMCDAPGTFGTNGTITVKFQTSSDKSTWVDLATSGSLTSLAKGQMVLDQPLPTGLKRYTRVVYVIGTAAFTAAAKFTAAVIDGLTPKPFAD